MEIVSIFDECLYSCQTQNGDEIGDELFDFLYRIIDIKWLREFFDNNISDLQNGIYGIITRDEAIKLTIEEANTFRKKLLGIKNLPIDEKKKAIEVLFRPLTNTESIVTKLQKSKAKGPRHKSWLRLYGIKVEYGVYVITGGTIKLTDIMDAKQHTRDELSKLSLCRDYLISEDIIDCDSFVEFLNG